MKKSSVALILILLILLTSLLIMYGFSKSNKKDLNKIEDMIVEDIVYPSNSEGIQLKININNDKLTLISTNKVNSYPNFFPGKYPFIIGLCSSDSEMLAEYGFGDPRVVQAEIGYTGPTWLNNTNFTLTFPFLDNTNLINIYSNKSLVLSIDVKNI